MGCVRWLVAAAVAAVAVVAAMLLAEPAQLDVFLPATPLQRTPVAFALSELPPMPATMDQTMTTAAHVGGGVLQAPESLAESPTSGWVYMSLGSGRIVRVPPQVLEQAQDGPLPAGAVQTVLQTGRLGAQAPAADFDFAAKCGRGGPTDTTGTEPACGRPLGMRFTRLGLLATATAPEDDEEVLLVADPYRGLLLVRNLNSSDGSAAQAMVLAERAEGDAPDSRFVFLNDLSIDPETGVAIISESTRVYPRRRVALALFDGHADGRLLAMLPGATLADVRVIVLQDGLFFPNGVQLVPKQPGRPLSVLVAGNISTVEEYKLEWAKGSDQDMQLRVSERRLFALLPGIVDNVRVHNGEYLVALGSKYSQPFALLKFASGLPRLRELLTRFLVYEQLVGTVPKIGMVAVLGEDGNLRRLLADPTGRTPFLSEVHPLGSRLLLGSWYNNFLAIV